jgi:atrial natriuretic peptide receptor A
MTSHVSLLPTEPFPEYAIVIIVLGSLLIVVLLASFFIYR